MNYHKVNGHPNLIRDNSTKAILNTNSIEYQNYISLKKAKELETKRIDNMEASVNNLKTDLDEIKNLLIKLTNESR